MGDGELGAPIGFEHKHRFNFGDEGGGPIAHHLCGRLQVGLRLVPKAPNTEGAHGGFVAASFCDKVDQGSANISGSFEFGYEGRAPNHLFYEGGYPVILQWQAAFYGAVDKQERVALGLTTSIRFAVPILKDGSLQIDLPGVGVTVPMFRNQGSFLEHLGLEIPIVGLSGVVPF